MDLAGPSHADRTDVVDEVPATRAARTWALDSRGGKETRLKKRGDRARMGLPPS